MPPWQEGASVSSSLTPTQEMPTAGGRDGGVAGVLASGGGTGDGQ